MIEDSNLIEIGISDVSITNVGFAIFLKPIEKKFNRVVPIFIGPLETYSISSALDGIRPPRPNTHDLMVNMIQEMEASISHVVINDIIGNVFYARIVIQAEEGTVELDARPSDSVAIAIRSKCKIYMNEKVYQEASVIVGNESEINQEEESSNEPLSELEKMKKELEQAVENENFEKAALLRDKIKQISKDN